MAETDRSEFRLQKHRWIAELVAGKTFADVGGLWGTVNETVSIALQHGAREATMIDMQPSGSRWWTAFHERCSELGVAGYHTVVGDICNDRIADTIGPFDVTHCSGVVYHVPNAVDMIRNLISITRERFILSSMIVPDVIANRFGKLVLEQGQLLLVPALSESPRRILGEHFDQQKIGIRGINAKSPLFAEPNGRLRYGPWWWIFTAETLVAMCRIFDVSIEKTWVSTHGSISVLARLNSAA